MQMIHQEQFFVYLALTRLRCPLPHLPIARKRWERTPDILLSLQLAKLGYSAECAAACAPTLEDPASFFANPEEALSLLPAFCRKVCQEAPPLVRTRAGRWQVPTGSILSELRALSYSNTPDTLPQELARAPFSSPAAAS